MFGDKTPQTESIILNKFMITSIRSPRGFRLSISQSLTAIGLIIPLSFIAIALFAPALQIMTFGLII